MCQKLKAAILPG